MTKTSSSGALSPPLIATLSVSVGKYHAAIPDSLIIKAVVAVLVTV